MALSSSPQQPLQRLPALPPQGWWSLLGVPDKGAVSLALLVVLSREVTQWMTTAPNRTGW
jgi:hypothetical protein